MRIGLFGGTFDPLHIGHLIVAQDVLDALRLDEIRFLVSARPPHKSVVSLTEAELRWRMVAAAVEDEPRFVASRVELDREGPSYTVQTLRELVAQRSDHIWHLIIGSDQLAEFGEWHEPREILRLARLVVMTRPGWKSSSAPLDEMDLVGVPVTRVEISSTEVRRRVAQGKPVRHLVPEPVWAVIEEYGLYRSPAAAPVASRITQGKGP